MFNIFIPSITDWKPASIPELLALKSMQCKQSVPEKILSNFIKILSLTSFKTVIFVIPNHKGRTIISVCVLKDDVSAIFYTVEIETYVVQSNSVIFKQT